MELIDALAATFDHTHGVIANIGADQFDNKTPGDESDDIFVQGPPIQFKPEP